MVFTPIAGVPAAPPASGLWVSRATLDPPPRWETGIAWVPERGGTSWQLVPWCDDPDAGYTTPRGAAVYYRPVPARVADSCSTMGGGPDLDRARRVAEATFPWLVARELWSGPGTQADPYSTVPGGPETETNAYLASPAASVVGASAASPLVALGRLEQAAVEASQGQAVMLHIPVVAAPLIAEALFRVGQSLLTPAGNPVVVDGGYPGTGPAGQPAGSTVWAYATAPVAVLASGWDFTTEPQSTVDPSINDRTVWASQLFAAVFDPGVHLATEITIQET